MKFHHVYMVCMIRDVKGTNYNMIIKACTYDKIIKQFILSIFQNTFKIENLYM